MRIWSSLNLLLGLLLTVAGSSAAQETNFPVGPQYLITSGSPLFLQPIATPSLLFGSGLPAPSAVSAKATADEETVAVVAAVVETQRQIALPSIYYGLPRVNVVEIASGEEVSLPASILGPGVVEFITPQALRERGYGVTLAEAAARWKTHAVRARRVYTNEDVERLRPRD
jgi:hypothetical protein